MKEKKITQLDDNDRDFLRSKSPEALPDNPSNKGLSAAQIKAKMYEAILVLFEWLKITQKEVNDFFYLLDKEATETVSTRLNEIIEGILPVGKAISDEEGSNIKNTYVKKEQIAEDKTSETAKLATLGIVKELISDLINGSVDSLDTLKELANALGNDANFSKTVLNLIDEIKRTKLDKVGGNLSNDFSLSIPNFAILVSGLLRFNKLLIQNEGNNSKSRFEVDGNGNVYAKTLEVKDNVTVKQGNIDVEEGNIHLKNVDGADTGHGDLTVEGKTTLNKLEVKKLAEFKDKLRVINDLISVLIEDNKINLDAKEAYLKHSFPNAAFTPRSHYLDIYSYVPKTNGTVTFNIGTNTITGNRQGKSFKITNLRGESIQTTNLLQLGNSANQHVTISNVSFNAMLKLKYISSSSSQVSVTIKYIDANTNETKTITSPKVASIKESTYTNIVSFNEIAIKKNSTVELSSSSSSLSLVDVQFDEVSAGAPYNMIGLDKDGNVIIDSTKGVNTLIKLIGNAVLNGKQIATIDDITKRITSLINNSPAALDTLNELANALGNDPNFATTITNEISKKANKTDVPTKLSQLQDDTDITPIKKADISNKFVTPRKINNVDFDGTTDITVTANPKANLLSNQDLNNIKTTGFYYAGGSNTVVNKPIDVDAFGLLVYQDAAGYIAQELTSSNLNPLKKFIRQWNAARWSDWTEMKYTDTTYDVATTSNNGLMSKEDKVKLDNSFATLQNKADLVGGKIPASQLPSYVDDSIECPTKADFPAIGESGKIYVSLNDNLTYRWSGTQYVEISKSLALGETSSTAYPGDKGKQNAENIAELQQHVGHIYRSLEELGYTEEDFKENASDTFYQHWRPYKFVDCCKKVQLQYGDKIILDNAYLQPLMSKTTINKDSRMFLLAFLGFYNNYGGMAPNYIINPADPWKEQELSTLTSHMFGNLESGSNSDTSEMSLIIEILGNIDTEYDTSTYLIIKYTLITGFSDSDNSDTLLTYEFIANIRGDNELGGFWIHNHSMMSFLDSLKSMGYDDTVDVSQPQFNESNLDYIIQWTEYNKYVGVTLTDTFDDIKRYYPNMAKYIENVMKHFFPNFTSVYSISVQYTNEVGYCDCQAVARIYGLMTAVNNNEDRNCCVELIGDTAGETFQRDWRVVTPVEEVIFEGGLRAATDEEPGALYITNSLSIDTLNKFKFLKFELFGPGASGSIDPIVASAVSFSPSRRQTYDETTPSVLPKDLDNILLATLPIHIKGFGGNPDINDLLNIEYSMDRFNVTPNGGTIFSTNTPPNLSTENYSMRITGVY